MSKSQILDDVTLCAIVRDEVTNPAGGIEDFIHSTLPYVSAAVIVDTGSKDRTWQKLRKLKKKYPHLRVFRKKFTDFATMRNFSLSKAGTSLALVLDADERLFPDDFEKIATKVKTLKRGKKIGLNFNFWHIYPQMSDDNQGGGHNPRLFKILPGVQYKNLIQNSWEYLHRKIHCKGSAHLQNCHNNSCCLETNIMIKHFKAEKSVSPEKRKWYNMINTGKAGDMAPSEMSGFSDWKQLNPRRQQFVSD